MTTGWPSARLSEIAVIGGELVSPRESPYREMLHVGPEDIESGTGRLGKLRTAGELGLISLKYVFDKDAIVYSKIRPNLNKVARPGFRGLCSADAYPIRIRDESIDDSFLFQFLRSREFLKQVLRTSARTGMPKVNRQDLGAVLLTLPPRELQQQIGSIGDDFDSSVRSIMSLISTKQYFKRGFMQRLLTGQTRFSQFERERWSTRRFSEFFTHHVEENGNSLRTPLSCSKIHGIIPQSEKFAKRLAPEDLRRYKVVRAGDLVVDRMLLWDASLAFLDRPSEGVVSPDYATFHFEESHGDRDFFRVLLKSHRVRHLYKTLARGSNTRRRRVLPRDFLSITLPVPDREEQEYIGAFFRDLDREITLLQRQRQLFEKQKRAVMHRLLTGEVRLATTE